MKLAYLSEVRLPTKNAHGFQIMKMCDAFARAGVELELVVPWRKNSVVEDPFVFYAVEKRFRIKRLPAIDLYPIKFVPERIAGPMHLFSFLVSARIYFWFKRPDVLYTREIFAGFFFRDFVYEIHSLPESISEIYRWLIRRAGKVVGITNYLREAVLQLGADPKKTAVEPDAVDAWMLDARYSKQEARTRLGFPQDMSLVLYWGNFKAWKGVDTLAEATHLLPDNVFVALLGGTKESDVSRVSKTVGDRKNSRVAGFQNHAELPWFMAAADVLVIPNSGKEAISRFYTSPMKLFECMSSNRPIIASDLPSLREILNEQNAFFFTPDDPKSLAQVVHSVLANPGEARRRGEKAREDVEEHTWEKRARRIVAFLGQG